MDSVAVCPLCDRKCIVVPPVRHGQPDRYPVHYQGGRVRQKDWCEAGGWLVEDDEYMEAKSA